jgi:hypothetical protein
MKVRSGFVSNSSSSSFVVARNKNEDLTLRVKMTFSPETVITNVEELAEGQFGTDWEADASCKKEYNKCKKQLEAGKIIQVFRVANDDYDNAGSSYLYDHQDEIGNLIPEDATLISGGDW